MHAPAPHAHENRERAPGPADRRPLAIALAITVAFAVIEAAGGLLTNSLALLADAGHMATDIGALALALLASQLARRPATPERSYGYQRAETLAALANAAALLAVTIVIFWEAARRVGDPPAVAGGPMLAVALAGLVANAASAWVLARGGGGHAHDLNRRGALLHVLGDLLGSLGAILAAAILLTTGWRLADPLLSAAIGLLIVAGAWRLLREAVDVLLEATPRGIDHERVRAALAAVPGVAGVHDLHIWTISSGMIALSAHVEVDGARGWHDLLLELAALLRERFGIAHVTLQPEEPGPQSDALCACRLDAAPPGACGRPAPAPSSR